MVLIDNIQLRFEHESPPTAPKPSVLYSRTVSAKFLILIDEESDLGCVTTTLGASVERIYVA